MNSRAKCFLFFLALLFLSVPTKAALQTTVASTSSVTTNSFVMDPSSSDFTLSVWATMSATTTLPQHLFVQTDSSGTGRAWIFFTANSLLPSSFLGGSNLVAVSSITPKVPVNIILTRSGSTNSLFINGNLDISGSRVGESCKGLFIVGSSKVNNSVFNGTVYQVQLYNRALSASEIKTIALSRQFNLNTTGCILSYFFDEGTVGSNATGSTVIDHSASRINATAANDFIWVGNNVLSYP